MTEVATKNGKAVVKKDKEKLNIKSLIRDATVGKVTEAKFSEILTKHYMEGDWLKKRIKRLWNKAKKAAPKKS
jgi:hypothetical protein